AARCRLRGGRRSRSACTTLTRNDAVEAGNIDLGEHFEEAKVDVTEPCADAHGVEHLEADVVTRDSRAEEDAVVAEAEAAVRADAAHVHACWIGVRNVPGPTRLSDLVNICGHLSAERVVGADVVELLPPAR